MKAFHFSTGAADVFCLDNAYNKWWFTRRYYFFMATLVPMHFYFIFLLSLFPNVRKFQVTAFITTSTIPNLYKYKWFVALSIMQTSQWSCHKHVVYVAGFIRFHIVCMVHKDRDNTHCEVLQLNLVQHWHRVFQWVCHWKIWHARQQCCRSICHL